MSAANDNLFDKPVISQQLCASLSIKTENMQIFYSTERIRVTSVSRLILAVTDYFVRKIIFNYNNNNNKEKRRERKNY